MAIDRAEILEALGIRHGIGEWLGPALIGFGVGALVGGVAALLLAPRAGGELRDQLLGKARGVLRRSGEIGETARPEKNF